MSKTRRVSFNRGSIDSTIQAARKVATDAPRFVFATALGYTIDARAPMFKDYYTVNVNGDVTLTTYNPMATR